MPGRLTTFTASVAFREDDLSVPAREELEALGAARLEVSTGGGFTISVYADARADRRCLAVDDPEGKRPPVLAAEAREALRAAADQGALVLVTVPRSLCLESVTGLGLGPPTRGIGLPGERLREEWASVADVVAELVPSPSGDGVLRVWQNRWGPTRDIDIVYLSHRSRFVGHQR